MNAFLALAESDTPSGPTEKAALKDFFAALMTAEETAFKTQLSALVERYSSKPDINPESVEALVLRLNSQFPGRYWHLLRVPVELCQAATRGGYLLGCW